LFLFICSWGLQRHCSIDHFCLEFLRGAVEHKPISYNILDWFRYVYGSFTPSSTTPVARAATPVPACPTGQSACGALANTACNGANGNAYAYKCNQAPTRGFIIQPTNMKLKRELIGEDSILDMPFGFGKRQFSEPSLTACQLECHETDGCIAVTFQNQTDTCTMFAFLSGGYVSSPGTQFALAQPALDSSNPATTSSSFTGTGYGDTTASSSLPSSASLSTSSSLFAYAPSSSLAGYSSPATSSTASVSSSTTSASSLSSYSNSISGAPRSGIASPSASTPGSGSGSMSTIAPSSSVPATSKSHCHRVSSSCI